MHAVINRGKHQNLYISMQVCNENQQNTAEAYNFAESSGEK